MKLVAKTMAGLEPVLASELEGIGAAEIRIAPRAIYFEGDHEVMYRANFGVRTALRILLPIADFQVCNEKTSTGMFSILTGSSTWGWKIPSP